jgi:hypothetical protein
VKQGTAFQNSGLLAVELQVDCGDLRVADFPEVRSLREMVAAIFSQMSFDHSTRGRVHTAIPTA